MQRSAKRLRESATTAVQGDETLPITVNGRDGNPFDQNSMDGMQGRYIKAYYRLALSGNYPAGGDILDFTNGGVNSAVPPLVRGIEGMQLKDHAGSTSSFFGVGGFSEFIGVPGVIGAAGVTALNAWKMKFLNSISGEASAGAYSGFSDGSPLTDTLELEVTWFR